MVARWAFGLAAALTCLGCRPGLEADAIKLSCVFAPDPPSVGTAHVEVTLTGPDNLPIKNASVSLQGDLAHTGMVPTYGHTTETGDGKYDGSIDFSMAGDWVLIVEILEPGGRVVEKVTSVRVTNTPAPGSGGSTGTRRTGGAGIDGYIET